MIILNYSDPIVPGGNFTWSEYALLREWNTLAIPTAPQKANAVFLFQHLQALRLALGEPLMIKSGARTSEYTAYLRRQGIPAAPQSAHNDWCAVDLFCPDMSISVLWHWFDKRWQGRMELPQWTPTWIHLDSRNWGTKQRFQP